MVPSTKTPVSIASARRGRRQSNTAAAYGAAPDRARCPGDLATRARAAAGRARRRHGGRAGDEARLEVAQVDELEPDAERPP